MDDGTKQLFAHCEQKITNSAIVSTKNSGMTENWTGMSSGRGRVGLVRKREGQIISDEENWNLDGDG